MTSRPSPRDTDCRTTCPYCGVGCGVVVGSDASAAVSGDRDHPANLGRLCVKGANLHETTGLAGRLLYPRVNGQSVGWDRALQASADAIRASVERYGPESVAFYLSGQLLTEDYYVANKLAKGFLRTPHVDTNSRLCMSSAVAAHKRAFGADVVPGCYEDLELADLLVLVGSNTAWNHPVLYQRMKAAAREGRRVVVIDPRETATTELADLHLRLRPGSDTVLFNGLLVWLADHDGLDQGYIEAHCWGFESAMTAARDGALSVADVARRCDLAEADVVGFYRLFSATPRTVTAFSQGVNQSAAGTDNGNAIINCHLATGRIGRPGASPFSVTGQPNAMGGREVGGLANTLAAHMDYESEADRALVRSFWDVDELAAGPGLKAVDLFEAVHRGQIRVVWIMATNPAVSLPDATRVREALSRCPTVIVSDCMADTDTAAYADILLPAAGWGEKSGTVTNSERRISRQRAFLPLPGDARSDWWIISSVARRLGYGAAFDYDGPAAIFREHAALSACGNDGQRTFNLGRLAHLSDQDYDQLAPLQWPVTGQSPQGTQRLFGDGQFDTPDCRARFVPINPVAPIQQPTVAAPMVVNTGRIRDQWHTMTRTAKSARLLQHRSEPFIEINPLDAQSGGLAHGELGMLTRGNNRYIGRVRLTDAQRPGEVFVPIHWSRRYAAEALASGLIAAVTDPVSGQPELKHGIARLSPFRARWQARVLTRPGQFTPDSAEYWSQAPQADCDSWWLAGRNRVDWAQDAERWLGGIPQLVMADPARGVFRAARLSEGQLQAILLVDTAGSRLPDISWLIECFAADPLSDHQRRALLAARDIEREDIGAVVCSCFQVGERQIARAIEAGATSTEALADQLKCGSHCGSCLPEIKELLRPHASGGLSSEAGTR